MRWLDPGAARQCPLQAQNERVASYWAPDGLSWTSAPTASVPRWRTGRRCRSSPPNTTAKHFTTPPARPHSFVTRSPVSRSPFSTSRVTMPNLPRTCGRSRRKARHMIEREIQGLLTASDERLLMALAAARDELASYAIDLDGKHTIANRRATSILVPEDYAALSRHIRRSVHDADERVFPHVLRDGQAVSVRVSPVMVGDAPVGALVVLHKNQGRRVEAETGATEAVEDWRPFKASAKWLAPARASLRSAEPILIIGEPGSGKSAVAAAIHRNSGALSLRVIDCASLEDWASCRQVWRARRRPARTLLDLEPALQARLVGFSTRNSAQAARSGDRISRFRGRTTRVTNPSGFPRSSGGERHSRASAARTDRRSRGHRARDRARMCPRAGT